MASVMNAVFRAELDHYSSDMPVNLSYKDGPVSTATIRGLSGLELNLVTGRAVTLTNEGFTIDGESGERIVDCEIDRVLWTSPLTVSIDASTSTGSLGGGGATYHAVNTLFGWRVVSVTGKWVS